MTRRSALCLCLLLTTSTMAACGGQEAEPSDPGSTVATSDPSSTFATTFVSEHNRIRSQVTEPASYVGAWTQIPQVAWSVTLAEAAQVWANQLRDSNDCKLAPDPTTPYGENLAYGSVGFGPTQTIAIWEQEKAEFVYSPNYAGVLGHYTQMIWRDTQRIGCAEAACPTGWRVMVCRYEPAGNLVGAQPF